MITNTFMLLKLKEFISEKTILVRAPGRINLIGEHTDYNEGFVLPAAIDKAAYIALTPGSNNTIHLYAVDLAEEYVTAADAINKSTNLMWPNYLLGVIAQFQKAGIEINGFDAALIAEVPVGAGLSSSAAVECAMAIALNEMTNAGLDKLTLTKMAQKAEHEFAGVQCGIMDQFASMFGKKNHVIKLDCRSLEYKYVPFNLEGVKIVLFDTNVKHSLASSEYNVRREQCKRGIDMIKNYLPGVNSLRDVTLDMLDKYILPIDKLVYNRCKYVVEENIRLQNGCIDLEKNDIGSFGKKMFETHNGLSILYEVSCKELDFLVEAVKSNPLVLGARMMGGGFGGCTINLVKEEGVDELVNTVSLCYKNEMKKDLKAYIAVIADGATVIK